MAMSGVDTIVHYLAESVVLRDRLWLILPTTLAVAGIYQLSPLTGRCLRACRSPHGFLHRHWSGRPNKRMQAWRIGIDYGISCIGCCAALMLVMCAVGMANPLWMVLLGVLNGLPKFIRHGRAVAIATGWALLTSVFGIVLAHTMWGS